VEICYRHPAFLDAPICQRIRRAMDAGAPDDAEVLHDTIERRDEIRRAASIELETSVVADVERRLEAERDAISAFFGLRLPDREGAGFVRYHHGGFYRPHRDRAVVPSWPGAARRLIAIVTFLNGDFEGGLLRLFPDGRTVDVQPEEGLLVAFRADLLHEVTEVRQGTRDAIVDWFCGGP
jgi:predicted 2-oxoglutarate/Fe(II)-dependent dioxygenase YbiX